MNHFDMMDFRLFVQVAEANSLRQGAANACLSAPAASARIANIEARTGTKLLARSSRGMSITPAGRAFLYHAKQVLEQIENLNADLQEYARSLKGHLRIAANPTAIKEFLPGPLKAYLPTHADVRLDLREMLSTDIVRAVSAGTTDIGVVLGHVRTDDLEAIEYASTSLVMVVANEHPLAGLESITFARLLEYELVDFPEASPTYIPLHNAAEQSSLPVRVRARATTLDSLCSLVEAGVGVGVAPAGSARRAAEHMEISVVPITDKAARISSLVCARRFKALPTFARDFVNALLAHEHGGDSPTTMMP